MLQFIYSDKVEEDISLESASSLYKAADKYAMETLKQRCSAIMRSAMCVESVLDVLKLANMHNDQQLKSLALEFISANDNKIVGFEQWNRFEEENKQLAYESYRSFYWHLQKTNKRLCVRG